MDRKRSQSFENLQPGGYEGFQRGGIGALSNPDLQVLNQMQHNQPGMPSLSDRQTMTELIRQYVMGNPPSTGLANESVPLGGQPAERLPSSIVYGEPGLPQSQMRGGGDYPRPRSLLLRPPSR